MHAHSLGCLDNPYRLCMYVWCASASIEQMSERRNCAFRIARYSMQWWSNTVLCISEWLVSHLLSGARIKMPLKPKNLRGQELNPVFHFQTKKDDDNEFSHSLIKNARKTGCLKLAGRGLSSGVYMSVLMLLLLVSLATVCTAYAVHAICSRVFWISCVVVTVKLVPYARFHSVSISISLLFFLLVSSGESMVHPRSRSRRHWEPSHIPRNQEYRRRCMVESENLDQSRYQLERAEMSQPEHTETGRFDSLIGESFDMVLFEPNSRYQYKCTCTYVSFQTQFRPSLLNSCTITHSPLYQKRLANCPDWLA